MNRMAGPPPEGRSAAIRGHVASRVDAHLEMLREMVAINSFTKNAPGVDALGGLTARRFADLGFTAERVPSARSVHGDHVVLARPAPGASAGTIGLVSHLDTVFPPEEEKRNDFRWREIDDRIIGPGTVDIKGGTVMIRLILETIAACAPKAFDAVDWSVLLDATEEVMSADFGALARERIGSGGIACLVFEGGRPVDDGFCLVTSRKGMAMYDVFVEGRGAHAGVAPEIGASAIWQLAKTVDRMSALADPARSLSVNVGTMSGGEATNRVAHAAAARLEIRAFDPAVLEQAIADLEAIARRADVTSGDGTFTCRIRLVKVRSMSPWPANTGSDRLFAHWQAAGDVIGTRVSSESRGGLSDGNSTWSEIPTLDGLGPVGGNMHCSEDDTDAGKEQEYISRSAFGPKAVLNTLAVLDLIDAARGSAEGVSSGATAGAADGAAGSAATAAADEAAGAAVARQAAGMPTER